MHAADKSLNPIIDTRFFFFQMKHNIELFHDFMILVIVVIFIAINCNGVGKSSGGKITFHCFQIRYIYFFPWLLNLIKIDFLAKHY
jgi:hypothetical protein